MRALACQKTVLEAQRLGLARPEVGYEDVGDGSQPPHEIKTCLRGDVGRRGALAAVPDVELRPPARRVAARRLHLQHVGALVGKELTEVLPGGSRRQLQYANAV